jgi:hypothetical protein
MERWEVVAQQERDRAMVMARSCRDLQRLGRVTVAAGAVAYWLQVARCHNDALCRSLHGTSVRFNSHAMPTASRGAR